MGAPLMAHCISRTRSHPKNHTTEQHITNIAIHEIDICRWLLGEEIKEVSVRFRVQPASRKVPARIRR